MCIYYLLFSFIFISYAFLCAYCYHICLFLSLLYQLNYLLRFCLAVRFDISDGGIDTQIRGAISSTNSDPARLHTRARRLNFRGR